mgnify:CR=1 FL=1
MVIKEEVLAVVNGIAERELKLVRKSFTPLTGGRAPLSSMGIDSLEYMVLYMWLGEVYGIDTKTFAIVEKLGDASSDQLTTFIVKHATKHPSAKAALALYDAS